MYFRPEDYEKELQGWNENAKVVYLPSRTVEKRGLKVQMEHGEETYYPAVPLTYVNQDTGTEKMICETGRVVLFPEAKHFLLVDCQSGGPGVIDMWTGTILRTLDAGRYKDERTIHAFVPEFAVWCQPLRRGSPPAPLLVL